MMAMRYLDYWVVVPAWLLNVTLFIPDLSAESSMAAAPLRV